MVYIRFLRLCGGFQDSCATLGEEAKERHLLLVDALVSQGFCLLDYLGFSGRHFNDPFAFSAVIDFIDARWKHSLFETLASVSEG